MKIQSPKAGIGTGRAGLQSAAGLFSKAGLYLPSTKTISYYLSQSILGLDPSVPASLRDSADNEADFGDTIAEWQNQGTGASDATQATALNQPTLINEQGLYLPGVDGNGAAVGSPLLPATDDFSLEIVFVPKSETFPGAQRDLYFQYTSSSTDGRLILSYQSGLTVRVFIGDSVSGETIMSGGTLTIGVENIVTLTRVATSFSLRVNGVEVDTATASTSIDQANAEICTALLPTRELEGVTKTVTVTSPSGNPTIDFTAQSHGATSFTASTGQTVTINQSGDNPARIIKYHEVFFDGLNNRMDFTWNQPTGDYWFVSSSDRGVLHGEISLTNGQTYSFDGIGLVRSDLWQYGGLKMGLAIFDPAITAADKTALIALAEGKSANPTWAGETNFYNVFRHGELVSFPLIDTSNVINFASAWLDNNLTSFPLIDTSSATNFSFAWYGNNLTSFPLINTSKGTNFYAAWRDNNLTNFPLLDTSSGTNFSFAWRGNNLTSFPLIDTSKGTNFASAWLSNNLLTSFPAAFFDSWNPSSITSGVFNDTWDGCNSLTAQSVENILVSLDTSGIYGTNTGLVGGTTLADNTIDIDSDGSALTGAATTAITNLKSKDWQISYNGVLQ